MPQSDNASSLNLTGLWHGLYSYPFGKKPVSFVATLSDSDGWFNGTTEEVGTAGDAIGQRLIASLQGRRSGRSVTMLKIYHGPYVFYDSVHYAGDLNEDGTEISGTWHIAGSWSGTFLMIRSRTTASAETEESVEQT
ncbi:MAG TPA: hypothetical protein VFE34_14280 [Dongiaceae bacterium]|jgi:hypothetical protein|nr:hypothetical protein [Dongiaceae bacterium]